MLSFARLQLLPQSQSQTSASTSTSTSTSSLAAKEVSTVTLSFSFSLSHSDFLSTFASKLLHFRPLLCLSLRVFHLITFQLTCVFVSKDCSSFLVSRFLFASLYKLWTKTNESSFAYVTRTKKNDLQVWVSSFNNASCATIIIVSPLHSLSSTNSSEFSFYLTN